MYKSRSCPNPQLKQLPKNQLQNQGTSRDQQGNEHILVVIVNIYWFYLPILLFISDFRKGWKELKGKGPKKKKNRNTSTRRPTSYKLLYLVFHPSKKLSSITWCIEMNTIEIPNKKFIVKVWPNNAADAMPVKIVATVDEYFFKIVSEHINQQYQ
jgi:hypothetical protein